MINIDFNNIEDLDLSSNFFKSLEFLFSKELFLEDLHNNCFVTITFITPEEIKNLNNQYRNKDKTTDVLSFPVFTSVAEIKNQDESLPVELGDIFVNIEQAQKQADEYGNTLEYELLYLILHSFLHLLNYDHMLNEDKKVMRKREKELLNLLDINEN